MPALSGAKTASYQNPWSAYSPGGGLSGVAKAPSGGGGGARTFDPSQLWRGGQSPTRQPSPPTGQLPGEIAPRVGQTDTGEVYSRPTRQLSPPTGTLPGEIAPRTGLTDIGTVYSRPVSARETLPPNYQMPGPFAASNVSNVPNMANFNAQMNNLNTMMAQSQNPMQSLISKYGGIPMFGQMGEPMNPAAWNFKKTNPNGIYLNPGRTGTVGMMETGAIKPQDSPLAAMLRQNPGITWRQ